MSSASVSTRDEKSFIASRYSAGATSTRRPGASKYRTALGSSPGRKILTASFSQSGSSPSRSATAAAARRTESVGAKTASRSRVARRPSKQSAIAAPPTRKSPPAARPHRVQLRALGTAAGFHRRRADPDSYSAQRADGDEDAPCAERRRRLLKCGWVHPAQRRHEPPLAGVPPRLASPRRERPVVTTSQVLRQPGERSVHLDGARSGRLLLEPPACDRGTSSGTIMRIIVKELDDGVSPHRLKRLPVT